VASDGGEAGIGDAGSGQSGTGGSGSSDDEESSSGCGCAVGHRPGSAGLLLVLGGFLVRRRVRPLRR
jgi:MYXO-CTERM domain-containing protein